MLPSLAAIPHLSHDAAKRKGEAKEEAESRASTAPQQLITLWDPKSNGAEAYRGMRSALMLSSIDNPPRVIVITSAFPKEGKTTTALNLAIVLAQRGERVLLVDADLRRGSLHRAFGLVDQSVGLSTALSQPGVHLELPDSVSGFADAARAGDRAAAAEPSEMLSSNRMEEQMRQWRQAVRPDCH